MLCQIMFTFRWSRGGTRRAADGRDGGVPQRLSAAAGRRARGIATLDLPTSPHISHISANLDPGSGRSPHISPDLPESRP